MRGCVGDKDLSLLRVCVSCVDFCKGEDDALGDNEDIGMKD